MKGRMVHVWYMSEKHIPCCKPFVHQGFRVVMVYGYMFFRKTKINFFLRFT